MAVFEVTDNETGEVFEIEGDVAPTDAEVQELIDSVPASQVAEDATIPSQAPQEALQASTDIPIEELDGDGNIPPAPTGEDPGTAINVGIGFGQGLEKFVSGLKQFGEEFKIKTEGRGIGGTLGFDSTDILNDVTVAQDRIADAQEELNKLRRDAEKEQERFDKTVVGRSTGAKIGQFLGETAPTLAVPGGVQGNIAKRILTGTLGGGLIGAVATTPDVESGREINTALGAGIGAVGGAVNPLVGKAVNTVVSLFGKKTAQSIIAAGGDELLQSTLQRIEAGKRLGLDLTPAEAAGSGVLGKTQGSVGDAPAAAKIIQTAGRKREADEATAVRNFLNDLSPEGGSAAKSIRTTALKIIGDEEAALAKAAKPFYDSSKDTLLPNDVMQELMKDPVIKRGYSEVLSNPAFQKELKDADINSIQMVDLVKRNLNDRTALATDQFGKSTNEGRIIGNSTRELLDVADVVSPDYAIARNIYSVDGKTVRRLKEGVVGRVSRLKDDQLKTVSKIIFDPNETNLGTVSKMAKRFAKEDPDAWRRLLRNEFERRLDSQENRNATTFFRQILKKEKDFKLFLTATRDMPGSRKALIDMKDAFSDLIPTDVTARTGAGRAAQKTDQSRNFVQSMQEWAAQHGLDAQDEVMARIITNPRWHEELAIALKESKKVGNVDRFTRLMTNVASTLTTREE